MVWKRAGVSPGHKIILITHRNITNQIGLVVKTDVDDAFCAVRLVNTDAEHMLTVCDTSRHHIDTNNVWQV